MEVGRVDVLVDPFGQTACYELGEGNGKCPRWPSRPKFLIPFYHVNF